MTLKDTGSLHLTWMGMKVLRTKYDGTTLTLRVAYKGSEYEVTETVGARTIGQVQESIGRGVKYLDAWVVNNS